jgi:hypothetical protein
MDIFKKLACLNFPLGSYVVVGSGVLAALGLREAKDLDIAVNATLLKKLKKEKEYKEKIRHNKLFLVKDNIEIITRLDWEDYPTKITEAIKSAKLIKGFPFLNIKETIKFKRALGRKKDFKDIKLIEKYLAGKKTY